ncbi:MAG: hypothetical protein R3Y28_02395 [Candidatus Gastranaerophilales bacterium]
MNNFKNIDKKMMAKITVLMLLIIAIPYFIYLVLIPNLVSNEFLLNKIEDFAGKSLNAELVIEKPLLKTDLKSNIDFEVEEISLIKDSKSIINIENLSTSISLKEFFSKKIILNKFIVKDFLLDTNELLALLPKTEADKATPQSNFDWEIYWLDAILSLENCHINYNIDDATSIVIDAKDMMITSEREPKHLHFDLDIEINKNNKKTHIQIADENKFFIKDHKLIVEDCELFINRSKVLIAMDIKTLNEFNFRVYSKKFLLRNAVDLINTNLVIPDGDKMLAFFKDYRGDFAFDMKLTPSGIDGNIEVNKSSLKVKDVNDLPITINKGYITIDNETIKLNDFVGYYGNYGKNDIKLSGIVTDYINSVDTTITAVGFVTNDFMENYLSKIAGARFCLTADSPARAIIKSKYNVIDIDLAGKIETGNDILIEGLSLTPTSYDRAFTAKMNLEGTKLDIKSINYYIAKELNKNTKNIEPIIEMNGLMDIETLVVNNFGFNIPNPLPSEFFNVLAGQQIFKKGTIDGKMDYVIGDGIPKFRGRINVDKVRIPSQRLVIKEAVIKTSKKDVEITANGKFKKSNYDFKAEIQNSLLFPIVIKDISLKVEDIDVDRILNSMSKQNTEEVVENKPINESQNIVDEELDAEGITEANDAYVFDTNLLIIEKCNLEANNGYYKDITFNDMKADLTLDDKGIFKVKSNRFEFAQGHSSLDVFCDLVNHDYRIKLGAKGVDSDLIASTLLALPREISGKAATIIELNTDETLAMNGRIRFNIINGTIQKVGLLEYGLKFMALFRNPITMISPTTILDLVNIPEGNFDKIDGDITIENNIIEKMVIKSKASQLSSLIVGKFDLLAKDCTLRIYTKFSDYNKGFTGFLRNLSLNSLAKRVDRTVRNDSLYYTLEVSEIPELEQGEEGSQIFLTTVDGDVENFNFISSLKKIK